jgi:hypothetical protein
MPIPETLLDAHRKAPEKAYEWICIPLRYSLGLLFLLIGIMGLRIHIRAVSAVLFVMGMGVVFGLLYKLKVNPLSWKNYMRAILVWLAIAILSAVVIATSAVNASTYWIVVGLLVLLDVFMGQQSKYTAKLLGKLKHF